MKNKEIRQLGERGLLNRFLPHLQKNSHTQTLVGPGDDAALLKNPKGSVLSIDGLTEGIHFRLRWEAACKRRYHLPLGRGLGRKALGSSLSDLASMGDVQNRWALIYLGIPPTLHTSFVHDFYKGLRETAKRHRCALIGGDTVRSKSLTVVVAVGGLLKKDRPLRRKRARTGDYVCVAGPVGDAQTGLKILERKGKKIPRKSHSFFVHRFFTPNPLFPEGRLLNSTQGVTSLMDLSDSLVESIPLLLPKGFSLDVNVDSIPTSKKFNQTKQPAPSCLTGGEDYSLLFTVSPSAIKSLHKKMSFSVLGQVEKSKKGIRYFSKGKKISTPQEFRHFKEA